jgi:hypothetical protein
MPRDYGEPIPAAPFVAVLNRELERLATNDTFRLDENAQEPPAVQLLAFRLGVAQRTVYRYLRSLDGEGQPTDTYARNPVEDALERLEVPFADVYPEIAATEDRPLEPDAYCTSCHEVVTPIDGCCPWCDRPVQKKVPGRMFCPREDRMSFPANDGNCWRCGGELRRQPPVIECGCGCGAKFPRFDVRGREQRYLVGHAPRSLERNPPVDAEPFAQWLEQQLRDLDPIQSLARRVGLSREDVLAVLNRSMVTVELKMVRRSLWLASREGQGKGMPPRPGSAGLGDLYPAEVRSKVCPDCGGRKSSHAERCKSCATELGVYARGPRQPSSLTPAMLEEARSLRDREGLTFLAIAYRMKPRTRMTNVESVKNQLMTEFRRRGWPTTRLDRQERAA